MNRNIVQSNQCGDSRFLEKKNCKMSKFCKKSGNSWEMKHWFNIKTAKNQKLKKKMKKTKTHTEILLICNDLLVFFFVCRKSRPEHELAMAIMPSINRQMFSVFFTPEKKNNNQTDLSKHTKYQQTWTFETENLWMSIPKVANNQYLKNTKLFRKENTSHMKKKKSNLFLNNEKINKNKANLKKRRMNHMQGVGKFVEIIHWNKN